MRIGILASHPVQYDAPLYHALAERAEVMVYYAHRQDAEGQAAAGFGVEFEWDRDLLDGYPYRFLTNEATVPSTDTFFGCDTPEIAGYIAGGEYDAFVLNGWYLKSHWQAVRSCRRHDIPVLVRGDSQLRTPRSWWTQVLKEVGYRALLRAFDGFLYVGTRNREYLRHYGVPDEKCFFCPRFVDNDWFRQRAEQAQSNALRHRILSNASQEQRDAEEEADVLLFVGKLIEKKRPQDLIRAGDRLYDAGRNIAVAYVGAGPLEDDLCRLAEKASVPVHFAGFKNQTELPPYYRVADLLVLPSDGRETWGLVVNEGMACGLPAVVSDAVGCAPDLVDSGTTGERFPVGDIDQLADAIDAMRPRLGDDRMRQAIKAKMQTYSLDIAADGILDAAHTLAGISSS